MMRYWCVACGEPGMCTRKTTECGYCGYGHVSEYDKEDWDQTCKDRGRSPKPHAPGAKNVKVVLKSEKPATSITALMEEADHVRATTGTTTVTNQTTSDVQSIPTGSD